MPSKRHFHACVNPLRRQSCAVQMARSLQTGDRLLGGAHPTTRDLEAGTPTPCHKYRARAPRGDARDESQASTPQHHWRSNEVAPGSRWAGWDLAGSPPVTLGQALTRSIPTSGVLDRLVQARGSVTFGRLLSRSSPDSEVLRPVGRCPRVQDRIRFPSPSARADIAG